MRRKLKDAFNRHSKSLKRATATIAAALTLGLAADAAMPQINFPQPGAPGPAPVTETAPVTNINDGVMYWKHADYDMVVKTWPCEDRGLCASFQSINEKDPRTRELMALLKGYGKPNGWGFTDPDTDRVQDWEMTAYCGYEPDAKLKKQDDGSWDGTIRSPFNYQSYGLTVRQTADGKIRVSGYFTAFPLFWVSEEAERVTTPPPACFPTFPMW
ncbi:MAG: hypothetical protein ACAH83_19960 [Alphaproteobacteria bacterium]